jgi:hypothetical protein
VSGHDYFGQLSYQMLAPIIKQFGLSIPTKTVKGETHVVFETPPSTRFRILKLADDDYLTSAMTNHSYEVNSKSETV